MEEKIIQITAGRGPLECARVVYKVQEIFRKEAEGRGMKTEVMEAVKAEKAGTLLSTTLRLKGELLGAFLSGWRGSILWIGKSPYRTGHKRKNWFVGLEVFDQLPPACNEKATGAERDVSFLQESELRFETFRASGPGGQNVNKVETAVRATHLPSGLQVQVMDSRSQLENKKIAIRRLEEKLYQLQERAFSQQRQEQWHEHHSLERGNPVRIIRGTL
ncbi:peptide chain release factor H [Pedobacter sp. SYSU D00535]|uniref:peptide chain release factor H n=1 Tax=Pedobacter sp. SYSU D00535 TaxID=2810308 RepID=UPI001A96A668|nr:peptide chain release factor H [Pedobacter sp. SYSU D00535]